MGKISLQMYTMREHTKTLEDLNSTVGRLADIGFKTLQYSIPDKYDAKEVKKIFAPQSGCLRHLCYGRLQSAILMCRQSGQMARPLVLLL